MFYFHPYLGKISNLTHIFQMAWNHQLVVVLFADIYFLVGLSFLADYVGKIGNLGGNVHLIFQLGGGCFSY